MKKVGFSQIPAELHLRPVKGKFTAKCIEISKYQPSLRCSTGETIIGRDLESTLNDHNARELPSKKISDLCVQPFWCKTTFCEPKKSIGNIHLELKWSKLC